MLLNALAGTDLLVLAGALVGGVLAAGGIYKAVTGERLSLDLDNDGEPEIQVMEEALEGDLDNDGNPEASVSPDEVELDPDSDGDVDTELGIGHDHDGDDGSDDGSGEQ